jgi:hypothetical protein
MFRLAKRIKDNRHGEQHRIFCRTRRQKVGYQHGRQKQIQKFKRRKQHFNLEKNLCIPLTFLERKVSKRTFDLGVVAILSLCAIFKLRTAPSMKSFAELFQKRPRPLLAFLF